MFILYLTLSLIQNQITTSHSGTLCSQFSPALFSIWIVIWKTHTLYFIVPLNKVCLESGGWLRMVIWTSRSQEHNFYIKHIKLWWYGICPKESSMCLYQQRVNILSNKSVMHGWDGWRVLQQNIFLQFLCKILGFTLIPLEYQKFLMSIKNYLILLNKPPDSDILKWEIRTGFEGETAIL